MISVRPIQARHLDEADRIFRLAFGTFMNLPDPMTFMGDAELIRPRWKADPDCGIGAFEGEQLVGSNFGAFWGSFAFLGPLTVRPDLWDKGVAKLLLAETLNLFERRGVRHSGLFTFPHSAKHHGLYQKFGYWPQYLTPLLWKSLSPSPGTPDRARYSAGSPGQRTSWIADCARLTDEIFPGLDLEREIRSVADQNLGDTVLIHDGEVVCGFAIVHTGKGSEAGTGSSYVKFAVVRPGPGAEERFDGLLTTAEAFASSRGAQKITAGVNTARHEAYRRLLARGYKTAFTGVAMQRPNAAGFNRPDCFLLDDWR